MPFQTAAQQGQAQTTQVIDPRVQEIRALQAMLPPILAARYPDVIQMLFQTTSLSFPEKQYWIRLLPLMAEDQVQKLREILLTERTKLMEIQNKYVGNGPVTLGQAAAKRLEDIQEKKQLIKKQELVDQQIEESHEDALLEELNKVL